MKQILLLVLFLGCGLSIGVFWGQKTVSNSRDIFYCEEASKQARHDFYEEALNMTDQQKLLLIPIEDKYLNERKIYTERMNEAIIKLTYALEKGDYEGQAVTRILMDISKATRSLQRLSLQHLAQLEEILTQNQADLMKKYVVLRLRKNACP